MQVQRAGAADVAVVGRGEDAETDVLPLLLTAVPPCWQDPIILGWNKLRARPTLGAFSSVDRARCEAAQDRIEENNGVFFVFLLATFLLLFYTWYYTVEYYNSIIVRYDNSTVRQY